MKKSIYCLIFSLFISTQQGYSQKITELKDPKAPLSTEKWSLLKEKSNFSFSIADYSYSKTNPPSVETLTKAWNTKAWKGEKVHTQLVFWSNQNHDKVEISSSSLKNAKGNPINTDQISIGYISYVMTDLAGDLKNGCGINKVLDSALVADRITDQSSFEYEKNTTRPLWLSIQVPRDAAIGTYKGLLTIKGTNYNTTIPYSIEVLPHVLPEAKNWEYHLDLWQNPYSIARQYQVALWSPEHFKIMKPYYERLRDAGQKNITASIINDPWNGQTYDKYQAMIKWTKKKDGTWSYDYSIFDKWVSFMRDIGISEYINCYSMIPWNMNFQYFDERTGKYEILKVKTEDSKYREHWLPLLKDFAKHLKEKGYFEWTTIAMDERPQEDMKRAIAIIKEADPAFKSSLAGAYHPQISDQFADYSITLGEDMAPEVLKMRKEKGYKTTLYTCCSEIFPNTFTNSGYQEATWLAWNSVQRGFDGYLRWAFDCWNANPNQDTRHGTWLGGDTYFVYPDNMTSIRFEKLIEGVQDAEKIRILRQTLNPSQLQKLNTAIATFSNKNINQKMIPKQLIEAKEILNSL
ncbi:DUF4091 domain-containing protein [Sphingobacterium sp. SRCM116780]|uniref:DUF4091 domain-containing protein n=1 Tax=Sphingobacterium sp. SRCM116780 TaxID=2907623 RepID=UPI001F457349|nr:DUF4091 domain-containing protein [Sphingobacterium sp. SRCM116780]UIR56109.1 DUF4091 domain-containing protein [Sphingobacterium sp. SRCM116780]